MADYSTIGALIGLKPRRASACRVSVLNARPGIPFSEETFQNVLMLERRRAERSRRPFVLMLVHSSNAEDRSTQSVLDCALPVLLSNTRESDLIGWYRERVTVGIIFTEMAKGDKALIAETLLQKVQAALFKTLGAESPSKLAVSVHVFPEDWERDNSERVGDSKLYPELQPRLPSKHLQLDLKRAIDIIARASILVITFPLLAAIVPIIKLRSKGPVLFKQERVGQFAARFKCLKFRTMYTNCDSQIHRDYVQQYIAGNALTGQGGDTEKTLYKLTVDPRVTPIGRFLRNTSLDELPQRWNFFGEKCLWSGLGLRFHMSLRFMTAGIGEESWS